MRDIGWSASDTFPLGLVPFHVFDLDATRQLGSQVTRSSPATTKTRPTVANSKPFGMRRS